MNQCEMSIKLTQLHLIPPNVGLPENLLYSISLCRLTPSKNRILDHSRSFCQGALSGFHQATHFFINWASKVSQHSNSLLPQPSADRVTFLLPMGPLGFSPYPRISSFFLFFIF